ncbi:DUF697 domain-containing protein [Pseudomonadales bacterium]|nr:DUF697 domain-containing protein [Pseudomonadales bacterium]
MTDKTRRPGEISDLAEPVTPSSKLTESQFDNSRSGDVSLNRKAGEVNEEAELLVEKDDDTDIESENIALKKVSSPWAILLCTSVFLFLSWTMYDLLMLIIDVYTSNLFMGVVLAILGMLFVSSLVWLVVYEYKAWKSFDTISHRQSVINTAVKNNDLQLIKDTLFETLSNIKSVNPVLVSQFEDASFVNDTPEEYLRQLENIVLHPLDKQTDAIIKKSSIAAGLSVFIIPHPALDAIAVTWCGFILSNKVAAIYGVKPSGLSSFRLFKYILSNAVIAAGAEVASETIADVVGDNVTENAGEIMFGSLFSKVGEGAVTVWRIYRLGRIVRLTIRPRCNLQ